MIHMRERERKWENEFPCEGHPLKTLSGLVPWPTRGHVTSNQATWPNDFPFVDHSYLWMPFYFTMHLFLPTLWSGCNLILWLRLNQHQLTPLKPFDLCAWTNHWAQLLHHHPPFWPMVISVLFFIIVIIFFCELGLLFYFY